MDIGVVLPNPNVPIQWRLHRRTSMLRDCLHRHIILIRSVEVLRIDTCLIIISIELLVLCLLICIRCDLLLFTTRNECKKCVVLLLLIPHLCCLRLPSLLDRVGRVLAKSHGTTMTACAYVVLCEVVSIHLLTVYSLNFVYLAV